MAVPRPSPRDDADAAESGEESAPAFGVVPDPPRPPGTGADGRQLAPPSPAEASPVDPEVVPGEAEDRPGWHVRLFGSHEFFRLWLVQVVSATGDWLGFSAI